MQRTQSLHRWITPQHQKAIAVFQRGDLQQSTRLFKQILQESPQDSIASRYLSALQEFEDWGIDPVYAIEHWQQTEMWIHTQHSEHALRDSQSQLDVWSLAHVQNFKAARDETPHQGSITPENWPDEVRIAMDLYKRERIHEAKMWLKSYTDSLPSTADTHNYLRQLPMHIAENRETSTQHVHELRAPSHTTSEDETQSTSRMLRHSKKASRRNLYIALGVVWCTVLIQLGYILFCK